MMNKLDKQTVAVLHTMARLQMVLTKAQMHGFDAGEIPIDPTSYADLSMELIKETNRELALLSTQLHIPRAKDIRDWNRKKHARTPALLDGNPNRIANQYLDKRNPHVEK